MGVLTRTKVSRSSKDVVQRNVTRIHRSRQLESQGIPKPLSNEILIQVKSDRSYDKGAKDNTMNMLKT